MDTFTLSLCVIRFIILLPSLTGNALVCIVVLKTKSLRGITTLLLVNLAASDLAFGFLVAFESSGQCSYGTEAVESEYKFFQSALMSSFLLAAIAVERYYAVMKPFVHKVKTTKKLLYKIVIAICIISCVLPLPLSSLSGQGEAQIVARNASVGFKNETEDSNEVNYLALGYRVFLTSMSVLFPGAIIGFCYGKIIHQIWFKANANTNIALLRARQKMTKLLVTVSVAFYICWLPLFGIISSDPSSESYTRQLQIISIFPFISTVLNPIFYTLHSKPFRDGIKSTFNCCCCCCGKIARRSKNRNQKSFDLKLSKVTDKQGSSDGMGQQSTVSVISVISLPGPN